jgi:hypothetical protein
MSYVSLKQRDKFPSLHLIFDKPTFGYWDGGAKTDGWFTVEAVYPKTKTEGKCVKCGCWALNYFFTTGFGRSWKHAASIARRSLLHDTKRPCTVEIDMGTCK